MTSRHSPGGVHRPAADGATVRHPDDAANVWRSALTLGWNNLYRVNSNLLDVRQLYIKRLLKTFTLNWRIILLTGSVMRFRSCIW